MNIHYTSVFKEINYFHLLVAAGKLIDRGQTFTPMLVWTFLRSTTTIKIR